VSDVKTPPGANGGRTGFQPRWRLNIDDDGTITFDPTTQTITKIKTGESCYLGDYRVPGLLESEGPRAGHSGHPRHGVSADQRIIAQHNVFSVDFLQCYAQPDIDTPRFQHPHRGGAELLPHFGHHLFGQVQ
jgi:hypothetical protein